MSTLAVPASARRSPLRTTLTFIQAVVFLFSLASPLTVLATDPTPPPDPSPTEAPAPSAPAEPSETPAPSAQPSSAPEAPRPFIVTFNAGTDVASQLAVLNAAGTTSESSIPQLRMHAVALTTEQVSTLNADASVARVDLDRTRDTEAAPSDTSFADQWSLPKVGWDQLYGSVAIGGAATVAILDTGVDASHPDLDGVVLSGTSILDGSTGQTDANGHGTWMAGIVAAETDNGFGVAGTAYAGVSILPVTVLGADGTGQDSDIISGVVYAADAGADVILMSFSNPGYSAALQAAIDYAWASGAVLVAATGNDGVGTSTFPAGDRGVVGVTSTDASDTLADGANYGPAAFMAAPGESIVTTGAGGGVTTISGTSAAAAQVAGAAALLSANEPFLSNGVIVSRLAATADPAGDRAATGNGRLNLLRAMEATSTDAMQPAGAAPIADGGPFVGPYVVAANGTVSGVVTDSLTGLPIAGVNVSCSIGCNNPASTLTAIDGSYTLNIEFPGNQEASVRIAASKTGYAASTSGSIAFDNKKQATINFVLVPDVPANSVPAIAAASGTVTVNEGQTASNAGTWSDANSGDTLTLSASLGTVFKSGTNAAGTWSWSYGTTDGPIQSQTVTITANDGTTSSSTTFALTVVNVAPTATFNAPSTVSEGSTISLLLSGPGDPSSVDAAAGFTYAFSCDGTTFGAYGGASTAGCPTTNDETRSVAGRIRDKDGGVSTYTASVTVANVAPAVNAGADATIAEGGTFSQAGAFTDSGADTWSATVDYGDGSGVQALALSGKTFNLNHVYAQDGSYTVTVTVSDDDTNRSDTVAVTVTNVAPAVSAGADTAIDEGGTFTGSGSFSDPGADSWSATVDYGDGSGSQTLTLAADKTFSLSHTYADNGSYTVTVTVSDDDTSGSDTLTVTVANLPPAYSPPAVNAAANQGALEGVAQIFDIGSFTDAGINDSPWDVDIDWGDGAISSVNATSQGDLVDQSHLFANDGVYVVSVTVTDKDGGSDSDTFSITVANVAPAVNAGADATLAEGGTFSQAGAFTDSGADTWSATVDYGDGSPVAALALSGKTFNLNHVYAQDGNYTVTVTVSDDDTAGSDTVAVTVTNVAPAVSAGADTAIDEGGTFTGSGSFSDPGADSWSATVDYGDGSGSQTLTLAADKTFSLSHTYADNGSYTVTVTVSDDDTSGSDTLTVTVANLPPAIDSPMSVIVDPVTRIASVSATYTDPGALDTEDYQFQYSTSNGFLDTNTYTNQPNNGLATDSQQLPAGCYILTVTLAVTDDDGGSDSEQFVSSSNIDVYEASFRDPIKGTERNIVKWGNVVPVKVVLVSSCTGTKITDQDLFITLAKKDAVGENYSDEIVTANVNQPDTNQQMRRVDSMYMYNLATKGYAKDTDYEIRIRVGSAAILSPIILQGYLIAKK